MHQNASRKSNLYELIELIIDTKRKEEKIAIINNNDACPFYFCTWYYFATTRGIQQQKKQKISNRKIDRMTFCLFRMKVKLMINIRAFVVFQQLVQLQLEQKISHSLTVSKQLKKEEVEIELNYQSKFGLISINLIARRKNE